MDNKQNKRETGIRKEELAAEFLTRRGVKILSGILDAARVRST